MPSAMVQHGNHSAWTEEDDIELKQSLHQKEAITAQMIGIISSRLNSLQTMANNRKHGLACDLRVPGLQDANENRVAAAAKNKAVSSTTIATNQAMLERLFGPDEKTRLRTQVLKKNKIELQKNENRRNARVQLEKQLQASIEGHITRTVESFVYGGSDSGDGASAGVYINAKLFLLHTCERMRIVQAKKLFKRFLLSEVSCTLFEEVFWLAFCHFFQKDSMAQQRSLVEEISSKYVKMIATLHANTDYLFRVYPYAIASAVCWGFHYLFPGSRHLYTTEFKNEVYLFVSQLLLGLKLCSVSVQTMRKQCFPDEFLDDLSAKIKLTPSLSSSSLADSGDSTSYFLPRLQSPQGDGDRHNIMKKCISESYLGRQALSDNTIERILDNKQPIPEDSYEQRQMQPRTHQLRSLFNASQLSPLMKEYFGSQTKTVKKPCFLLRTTPSQGCIVGGEDTYHKYYRRSNQKNFAVESLKEQEKCVKEIQRVQHDVKRELDVLDETRDIVLSSGKKALQAYCAVLMSKKNSADEQET